MHYWSLSEEWLPQPHGVTSNKLCIKPNPPKAEPDYIRGAGWFGGYSFRHFWGNVFAHLGAIGPVDGVQQLAHHYYLQNGELNAKDTAVRIGKFVAHADEA